MRFGTDGVRGRVGVDLGESDVRLLGAAVGSVWPSHPVVIGHDGRESGTPWMAAFVAGIRAQRATVGSGGALGSGGSVVDAGLVPTPAIGRWSKEHDAVGVVISASHNPWHDNGVKVFAPGGRKLSDAEQSQIETYWQVLADTGVAGNEHGHQIGHESQGFDAEALGSVASSQVADDYVEFLAGGLGIAPFGETPATQMRVVVDCANGATSVVAPQALRRAGLDIEVLHASPSGRNINEHCGAMHPEVIAQRCAQRGVPGVAFDGDGDRLIAVDEEGRVVDGDRIIALVALDLHDRGLLTNETVVVTSMSNLGLHRALGGRGIKTVVTEVGDRHVLSAMAEGGFVLGGEQSGHLVHARHATTGDGLLSALVLLDIVRRSGRSLSVLAREVMTALPQVLRSVRIESRPIDLDALLGEQLRRERTLLGDTGRIVVRMSGTEPVLRIMVEAESDVVANAIATRLEEVVRTPA